VIRRMGAAEGVACAAIYAAACEWRDAQGAEDERTLRAALVLTIDAARVVIDAQSRRPASSSRRVWIPVSRVLADRLSELDASLGLARVDECFDLIAGALKEP
jgi:hypothetical protein